MMIHTKCRVCISYDAPNQIRCKSILSPIHDMIFTELG